MAQARAKRVLLHPLVRCQFQTYLITSSAILPLPPFKGEGEENGRASLQKKGFEKEFPQAKEATINLSPNMLRQLQKASGSSSLHPTVSFIEELLMLYSCRQPPTAACRSCARSAVEMYADRRNLIAGVCDYIGV